MDTTRRNSPRILLTLATTLALAGSGMSAHADTVDNGMGATVARATALRQGDAISGVLPSTQPMHIEVALRLRNRDRLDSFIAAATQPNATQQTMSREQFTAQHSPTQVQAQSVANYLIMMGFEHVVIAPNRMLVSADGTAGAARSAFLVSFERVQTREGRVAFANNSDAYIPAALQDIVLSVIGLQTVHQAHTFARPVTPNGLHINAVTYAITGHNPTEFSSIYGGSGVPTAAGIAVGIVTQGRIAQTINDLNTFTANNGLPTVATQTVNTNGTSFDTSGLAEWDLDSQDIVGMGGGQVGKLIFYNIPTLSNTNLTADFNTIVMANATRIINVSLGECETSAKDDGSAAAQDQIFQTAIAQGQTFSISTGDSGADECGTGGTTPSWPASSQYVVGVGGTTLDASTTTYGSETVWSGAGGSPSKFEPRPSWQSAVVSGTKRATPDVSFDADPNSGSKIIVNGSLAQYGGTSLSAPLFAGCWARMLAAHPGLGFAAPLLYQQLTAVDYHDVTSGNNGGETAAVGWDYATGFGSFNLGNVNAHIASSSSGNVAPVANFSFVTSDLTATFTDSSTDSDGTIASHSWTFGDGGTSTATSPSHTYAAGGTFNVTETVTDNAGATNSKTSSVAVSDGTSGNTLSNGVGVTISGATGSQVNYTVAIPGGSSNLVISIAGGTGDADLYVKFGSAPTLSSYDCRPYVTGNSESCKFSTPQVGTYYVMVNGYAAYSGVTLKAVWSTGTTNTAPTANFTFTTSGLTATFTDSSTDPQGNSTITGHSWNFGDGATSTTTSPSHTYAAGGTYSVSETVTDSGGLSNTKTASVAVSSGGTSVQLIGNSGFENGTTTTPWTMTSGVINSSASEPAHAGSWDAWMDGYGTSHTDKVSQQVSIPSGKSSATLSYYLHIDSAETTTSIAHDSISVKVFNTSGSLLATLATYSNLNKASGYVLHTNSLAAYIGKTVVIRFIGTENSSLQTSFVLDDVTLTVQ